MRPIYPGAQIAGPAVTVLAQPGDNWMIHVAVEQCQKGDVLVVGCTADNTDGMFGELLATGLRARGVKGLVIDAGCRDVKALTEMDFPVWSRAISAKGTVKSTLGAVNVPVVCAGVNVEPGDAVVADDDGVVVVPKRYAVETAQKAQKRADDEDGKRRRWEAGELSLDMYNMREPLAKRAALRRQAGRRVSPSTANFDLVVVGCGIAGLSAAATALQAGARVAILERSVKEERGGNTRWTEALLRMKSDSELRRFRGAFRDQCRTLSRSRIGGGDGARLGQLVVDRQDARLHRSGSRSRPSPVRSDRRSHG